MIAARWKDSIQNDVVHTHMYMKGSSDECKVNGACMLRYTCIQFKHAMCMFMASIGTLYMQYILVNRNTRRWWHTITCKTKRTMRHTYTQRHTHRDIQMYTNRKVGGLDGGK